jgi:hypothetical protein
MSAVRFREADEEVLNLCFGYCGCHFRTGAEVMRGETLWLWLWTQGHAPALRGFVARRSGWIAKADR